MPSAETRPRGLREAVALIERSGAGGDVSPAVRARPDTRVPLGAPVTTLDTVLGGGLRRGALHEVMAATARDAAATAAFAMALAMACAAGSPLIWIIEDRAAWETGLPYRPGLAAQGFDADGLVLVRTKDTLATLWAAEEALRAGASAVLTELWHSERYDLTASRRLMVAARAKGATCLLVPVGTGERGTYASAAETRFAVAARPGEHQLSAGHRTPIPGPAGFAVRVLKRRGAAAGGMRDVDRDRVHALVWDRERRGFRAPAAEAWQARQTRSVVA